MNHIRKSLSIFEHNSKTETIPYAIMLIKLSLLCLNQDQVQDCLKYVLAALAIFQTAVTDEAGMYEDEVTECLEILNRCYELLNYRSESRELLEQC